MQAISAVWQFAGRMIRRPECRNWLHFNQISCRLSIIGREKVYNYEAPSLSGPASFTWYHTNGMRHWAVTGPTARLFLDKENGHCTASLSFSAALSAGARDRERQPRLDRAQSSPGYSVDAPPLWVLQQWSAPFSGNQLT